MGAAGSDRRRLPPGRRSGAGRGGVGAQGCQPGFRAENQIPQGPLAGVALAAAAATDSVRVIRVQMGAEADRAVTGVAVAAVNVAHVVAYPTIQRVMRQGYVVVNRCGFGNHIPLIFRQHLQGRR